MACPTATLLFYTVPMHNPVYLRKNLFTRAFLTGLSVLSTFMPERKLKISSVTWKQSITVRTISRLNESSIFQDEASVRQPSDVFQIMLFRRKCHFMRHFAVWMKFRDAPAPVQKFILLSAWLSIFAWNYAAKCIRLRIWLRNFWM